MKTFAGFDNLILGTSGIKKIPLKDPQILIYIEKWFAGNWQASLFSYLSSDYINYIHGSMDPRL